MSVMDAGNRNETQLASDHYDDGTPSRSPVPTAASGFADVDASEWWAPHVQRLAELGVTSGCASEPARYCPDDSVTRAQMAAFLVRAFHLDPAPPAGFGDVDDGVHAGAINALAAAGVTRGCAVEPARQRPQRDPADLQQ